MKHYFVTSSKTAFRRKKGKQDFLYIKTDFRSENIISDRAADYR